MKRTIIALGFGSFLIVGAAAAGILAHERVPVAETEGLSRPAVAEVQDPVTNKAAKKDKLAVVAALAMLEPQQQVFPPVREPVTQAVTAPVTATVTETTASLPVAPPKPKPIAKPAPQKTYALLSDAQIASIKGRLNLSSSQESYWPAVEDALRNVAKKINAQRHGGAKDGTPPIDPDSAEVQQLKSAAMPLLWQLREDQKQEVRSLARLIGLDKVAAAI